MPEMTSHHNVPEYSVSEISFALKKTVEERFSHVRVRGEISGFKVAPSGHAYFTLKDDKSALSGICWRGTMGRLNFKPEDGLEVVCVGKMSTYPGRSNYQLIVEFMEPAGVGALMALLEKRKAQLAKEGLFDADCKLALPSMPKVIGVVTSPTGAVIRDILHRLEERFPTRVLVWPVLVQGDQAAPQIEAAIRGFNAMAEGGDVPRPDVLIVARGGGSIEDLWPFNEENVVRAVAESAIPLITAVGHETDTTLVDYASDRRAPTPTAAAEFAVPVRSELMAAIAHTNERLQRVMRRATEQAADQLQRASKLEQAMQRFNDYHTQRLDNVTQRFMQQASRFVERKEYDLQRVSAKLRHPREWLAMTEERVARFSQRFGQAISQLMQRKQQQVHLAASGLKPVRIEQEVVRGAEQLKRNVQRFTSAYSRHIQTKGQEVVQLSRLLDSYHYKKVLKRGFALVWEGEKLITDKQAASDASRLSIEFSDGKLDVDGSAGGVRKTSSKRKKTKANNQQESLF